MGKIFKFAGINNTMSIKEEDKSEFNELLTDLNINRCQIVAAALLILNIVLIIMDSKVYNQIKTKGDVHYVLHYAHITESVIIILWFALVKYSQKLGKRNLRTKFIYFIMNIVLYYHILFGLCDLYLTRQIFSYLICVLIMNAIICMRPLKVFFISGPGLVVFITGLHIICKDDILFYNFTVEACIVVFFSLVMTGINYSGLVRDFIYRKSLMKSKNELQALNQKLEEYEKLRTDFFTNISHELKTPLNLIYSAEQMIVVTNKKDNYANPKVSKYLNIVKQNCNRLLRLINNLIDITKIDSSSFEIQLANSNIVKVVEDLTMSVADYTEDKGIGLIFDTEIEEKIIACDPQIIERILLNLLANAVKYTEENGSIFVNIYLKDGYVLISVKDTGIGIAKEMQELIFDRFIQVDKSIKRKREGSGIGLALVKSLVELHGGKVSVSSELGKGSEFTIALRDYRVAESEAAAASAEISSGNAERINLEFSDIYE